MPNRTAQRRFLQISLLAATTPTTAATAAKIGQRGRPAHRARQRQACQPQWTHLPDDPNPLTASLILLSSFSSNSCSSRRTSSISIADFLYTVFFEHRSSLQAVLRRGHPLIHRVGPRQTPLRLRNVRAGAVKPRRGARPRSLRGLRNTRTTGNIAPFVLRDEFRTGTEVQSWRKRTSLKSKIFSRR